MNHKFRVFLGGIVVVLSALITSPQAEAHGERNQEPYLRMRTVHWYDVRWSTDKIEVNDEIVVTGKFRLFDDWPSTIPLPDTAFLGNATPGPVLVRMASYINGVPMIQSTGLAIDRDYEFKVILKARIPGRHHVHPMLNIQGAGGLVGPGKWVRVAGSADDFVLPVTTLTGEKIANLETWGVNTVVTWHLVWVAIALFWIVWWVRRPLLIPRYLAVQAGAEEVLITGADRKLAAGLLVGTILLVIAGYQWAEAKYPRTIPLQGGKVKVEPLPKSSETIRVKLEKANYDVPGRSMKMRLKVTNDTHRPVQLGEFTTANVRFINPRAPAAMAALDPGYPRDLVATSGLRVDHDGAIAPGETRSFRVEATDVAWETERLTSLLNDPDSRFGALLFFYDGRANRYIAGVNGPIIPTFVR